MRKVILQNMMSLDGFFAGPDGEIDWHVWDDEMEQYGADLLDTVGAMCFGRVTYQLMADYWPSSADSIAPKMNELPKLVFSRTLEQVEWNNSRLVKENIAEEVMKLKQQPGGDVVIFGSSTLAAPLMAQGLIDEVRIIVNPVILGSGTPLFKDIKDSIHLKLLKTRAFACGNVLLYYQPEKNK